MLFREVFFLARVFRQRLLGVARAERVREVPAENQLGMTGARRPLQLVDPRLRAVVIMYESGPDCRRTLRRISAQSSGGFSMDVKY